MVVSMTEERSKKPWLNRKEGGRLGGLMSVYVQCMSGLLLVKKKIIENNNIYRNIYCIFGLLSTYPFMVLSFNRDLCVRSLLLQND
jgi:hypothetical protein